MSPKYNEKFTIPKHLEVPQGAVIQAPVKENPNMKTGNWRTERPVIDHEKCTLCLNCFKGCRICVEVCPADALTNQNELDFKGGVARLEKPY